MAGDHAGVGTVHPVVYNTSQRVPELSFYEASIKLNRLTNRFNDNNNDYFTE